MRTIILDTETNKFKDPQIAQLSYIILNEERKVVKTVNRYFKLDYMSDGAKEVHKLDVKCLYELSGGLEFKDVAKELYEELKDSLIVCHNAPFDMRVLNGEFERALGVTLENESFCTMKHYKDVIRMMTPRGSLKNPKLAEVIDYLNIEEHEIMRICNTLYKSEKVGYHDARFDTTATLMIYLKIEE